MRSSKATIPVEPGQSDASAPSERRAERFPASPLAPARRRFYRLAAALSPLFLLLLVEGILRLAGYGYPTSFFRQTSIGGEKAWVENPQFAKRYFPSALARAPDPLVIPVAKGADTYRIMVLGESAALGDPEPAYGFSRMLEVLLQARYTGCRFHVINVSVTAINSHCLRDIARDCIPLQGDIWILYMGNNEVVGPFGAGTVFGARSPSPAFIRAQLALKRTRLGQGLAALRERLWRAPDLPGTWAGMEMFLRQQTRADDARLATVYRQLEANLEAILDSAQRSGARALVCSVVSNLKDCPPFASSHREGLRDAERAEWATRYQTGLAVEGKPDPAQALAQYDQAARLDDTFAELQFRRGRCQLALGQTDRARESFAKARDLDTLRFRPDTSINEAIRRVAHRGADRGVCLFDAEEFFAQQSPQGLIGEEFLYEHVHFNFEGNYLLARQLAEELAKLLPARVTSRTPAPAPLLSKEECARRLAWTDFDRHQVFEELVKRFEQPPFTQQLNHAPRLQRWRERWAELKSATQPEALRAAINQYREALGHAPGDWRLQERLARVLESAGDLPQAEKEWRQVVERIPHHAAAHYSLGNVLDAQGKTTEAVARFEQALRLRPESVEARNGLGLALASSGKPTESIRQFERALRERPDFAEARINLGRMRLEQGKPDEAAAEYREVLRRHSNNVPARINYGKLLAAQGRNEEARQLYEEAARLSPDNPVVHFNLGNALLRLGQSALARRHFSESIRLNPTFAEARLNLALELAAHGETARALEQFAEAVRLRPAMPDARLNYGVALARAGRYAEAVEQFQETVRLDPSNEDARKYLAQARSLSGRPP